MRPRRRSRRFGAGGIAISTALETFASDPADEATFGFGDDGSDAPTVDAAD